MNLLQTFMTEANVQARTIVAEDFTIVGESPSTTRLGTFGNPTLLPIMTRTGYQDHLVTQMTVERALFATAPEAKGEVYRTATGATYFVQAIDDKHPVIYTFVLTDRRT